MLDNWKRAVGSVALWLPVCTTATAGRYGGQIGAGISEHAVKATLGGRL
jgi:hypothetical protein